MQADSEQVLRESGTLFFNGRVPPLGCWDSTQYAIYRLQMVSNGLKLHFPADLLADPTDMAIALPF